MSLYLHALVWEYYLWFEKPLNMFITICSYLLILAIVEKLEKKYEL